MALLSSCGNEREPSSSMNEPESIAAADANNDADAEGDVDPGREAVEPAAAIDDPTAPIYESLDLATPESTATEFLAAYTARDFLRAWFIFDSQAQQTIEAETFAGNRG